MCSAPKSGLILCDCIPPASFVHGIFQARIVEWVVISFSRRPSKPRDQTWVSYICLLPWQVDCLPPSYLGSPSIRMLQCKRKKKEAIGFCEPLKKNLQVEENRRHNINLVTRSELFQHELFILFLDLWSKTSTGIHVCFWNIFAQ